MRKRRVLAKRYELREVVGTGGSGTVYRARDRRKREMVAVKLLHQWQASNPDFVERFRHEAEIAKDLKHPGIARVLDSGSDGDKHFIVMEFVDGETLQQLLEERGPIATSATLATVIQIAEALEVAHDGGIVHRDIKPANIKIARDGGVKVLDFGVAKGDDAATMTAEGTLVGTVRYLAPEQVENRADARSDIYSLGVVAYQMLTGYVPFRADNPWAVLEMHKRAEVPPLKRPGLTEPLEQFVTKCLQKNPGDRFQSMSELLIAARHVQEVNGWTSSTTLTSTPTWGLRLKRLARRFSIRRGIFWSARMLLRMTRGSLTLGGLLVAGTIIGALVFLLVTEWGFWNDPVLPPVGLYSGEAPDGTPCSLVLDKESDSFWALTNCGTGDVDLKCFEGWNERDFRLILSCNEHVEFELTEDPGGELKGSITVNGQSSPFKAKRK